VQISEQAINFREAAAGGHRFCYAIIEVPEFDAGELADADLRFTTGCADADLSAGTAVLVLAFDCGDVDCECTPLIDATTLRFTLAEAEAP